MASALAARSLFVTPIGILLLQECGHTGFLGRFQSGAAGVAAYPDSDVGSEFAHYPAGLAHALPQTEEHLDVSPQMLAVESAHGQTDDFISCRRHTLHFHAVVGADKEYFGVGMTSFHGCRD